MDIRAQSLGRCASWYEHSPASSFDFVHYKVCARPYPLAGRRTWVRAFRRYNIPLIWPRAVASLEDWMKVESHRSGRSAGWLSCQRAHVACVLNNAYHCNVVLCCCCFFFRGCVSMETFSTARRGAARLEPAGQVMWRSACADARKRAGWQSWTPSFKVMATLKSFICLLVLSVSVRCSPETLVPFIAWSSGWVRPWKPFGFPNLL